MRKVMLVLGVLALVAAAVAGFFYWKARGKVALDPVEVERMAAQMLPGAAPPAGFRGVLGLHLESAEVAVFAPGLPQAQPENLSGSALRIVIAQPSRPEAGVEALGEIQARMAEVQKRKAASMETLKKEEVELPVGGRPHRAQKTQEKLVGEGGLLTGYTLLVMADRRPVVVQILGPEDGFNQAAMEQFLAPLKVGAGLPGGLPGRPGEALKRLEERRSGSPAPPGEVRERIQQGVERKVEERVEEKVENRVEQRVEEKARERVEKREGPSPSEAASPAPAAPEPVRRRLEERRQEEGRRPLLPGRRGQ